MSSAVTANDIAPPAVEKKRAYGSILSALWPWIGYTAVTFFLLRDLLPLIADHLPGRTDGWQNMWNTWWMRYSLLDLHSNPFVSDYIYYPNGVDLLFHTYAPLNGVLALPFTVALGPLVTTNLLIISSFIFSGMAAYALGRGLGLGRFEAWLAGAVYTFCNPARWHYFGGGQADHLAMQWMPLYILCLVKATSREYTDDPKSKLPWKWLGGAALFYAFNGFTDWQFFVYLSVFNVLYAVYLLLRAKTWQARLTTVRNLLIIAAGGALIASPLLYPTVMSALNPDYSITPPLWQTILHSWDLTAYFTPNEVNPLWGGWAATQSFVGNYYGNILGIGNAGYAPLLLGAAGLIFYARRVYHWAIFGLIFAVLSLGPILHISGVDKFGANNVEVPMPYTLLLEVPFFNISRDPSRYSLIAFMCLGLLAGFGWMGLRERVSWLSARKATGYAAMALASIAVVGEFSTIRYDITTQPVPPFFYQLAQDKETYALLEVPVADKFYAEYTEALQSIHHKKITGGQTARKPCYCFPMETPVLRWFWDRKLPSDSEDIVTNPDPATYAPAMLRFFDLRYIVIYKWMLSPEDYEASSEIVQKIMPGATPVADDDAATIYPVPPISSTTTVMPIIVLDDWSPLEQGSEGPQRWMGNNEVTLVVVNATHSPRKATMEMKVRSYNQPHTLQVNLAGAPVTTATVGQDMQTVSTTLTLAPGRNEITLSSLEPGVKPNDLDPNARDARTLTLVVFEVSIE